MPGPFIDPSIILLDPQFTDTFSVTSRMQSTNQYGEVVLAPTTLPGILGVVTPANRADLLRLPETERGNRAITIFSQHRLQSAANSQEPDWVIWRGDTFVVKVLIPWTAFGPGWTRAICTSIDSVEAQA
jgi:hypothetical protein